MQERTRRISPPGRFRMRSLALLLALIAWPAAAQTVRGIVVNDDARPLAGVLVVLIPVDA